MFKKTPRLTTRCPQLAIPDRLLFPLEADGCTWMASRVTIIMPSAMTIYREISAILNFKCVGPDDGKKFAVLSLGRLSE
jgi:hypothetical protein